MEVDNFRYLGHIKVGRKSKITKKNIVDQLSIFLLIKLNRKIN